MTLKEIISIGRKNGNSWFIRRQKTIVSAAIIIMGATLIAKVLGLFKLTLLANIFGLSRSLDIFYAADSIPQFFFNILVLGSFNTALIPILADLLSHKKKDLMWDVFNSFLNIFSFILIVVGIVGIVFSKEIAQMFVGLSSSYKASYLSNFTPADIVQLSYMMKILFISPIILGISFMLTGVLQVYKRFLVTQIAYVVYNLGFIIGILFFTPFLGVYGITLGVLLGSIFHLLVQFPIAKYLGFNYKAEFLNFKSKYVKEMFKLSFPRFLGIALSQVMYIVEAFIAFSLVPGSLTAFNWATSLFLFPVAIVGWSFAQASFPTLSFESSRKMIGNFKKTLGKTILQVLFLVIPLFMTFLILRLPIVRLILGPGSNSKFGWNDTILTSWILLFLSLSIVGQAVLSVLIRAFYSLKDTKTPLIVESIFFVLNIFLALYLVRVFGNFPVVSPTINNLLNIGYYLHFKSAFTWKAIGGLGAAAGIIVTLNVLTLIIILHRRLGGFSFKDFYTPAIKKFISGGIMGFVMYFTYKVLDVLLNTTKTIDVIFLFLITLYIGVSVYIIVSFILNDSDLDLITRSAYVIRDFIYGKLSKPISPIDDNMTQDGKGELD